MPASGSKLARQIPSVTTEVVLFTIEENRLRLLLVRPDTFRDALWALPGGSVCAQDDLDDCATRALADNTGVTGVYLEQLYTFGDTRERPGRHVVTVAYYALSPRQDIQPRAGQGIAETRWFDVGELPALAFNHATMVSVALTRLRAKLDYSTIALQFMAETFTLTELQAVYQTILGQPLDKRNFRKQMLALNRIEPTHRFSRNGNHRPARLFRAKHPRQVEIIK